MLIADALILIWDQTAVALQLLGRDQRPNVELYANMPCAQR